MASTTSLKAVVNFLFLQALWFACVIGAAKNQLLIAGLIFFSFVVWQLWPTNRHPTDGKLVVSLLVIGLIVDSLWSGFNLINYNSAYPSTNWAPYWILMLWVGFALTINHSLSWVLDYPKTGVAVGAIGGPVTYFGAERLGALEIEQPLVAAGLLFISWAIVMLYLVNGSSTKSRASVAVDKING